MPNIKVKRSFLLRSILNAIILLTLVTSCSTRQQSSENLELVWESWEIVQASYVDVQSLSPEMVTGEIIGSMLEAADKPGYPFLSQLKDVSRRTPRDVPHELTDIWRAWVLFEEKWPEIPERQRAEAAIQGMMKALGDGSARHLNADAYSRAQEDLAGNYDGIGAIVRIQDSYPTIIGLMDNKPAEKAGLQPGDVIHAVDGQRVEGLSLDETIKLVRGTIGSKVTLLVDRPGTAELQEFTITRGAIDVFSVDMQLLPGGIAYIYIAEFLETTGDEVLDALETLNTTDFLALILDLRGNQGGSLEAAKDVASQFIQSGLFMYSLDKNDTRQDWVITKGAAYKEDLPLAVIVSEFTANAAEALTGALQDRKDAAVIGVRTSGRGAESSYLELRDGSALYLPIEKWFTPNGHLFYRNGIEPNIIVDITQEDFAQGKDSQVIEAYNYLDNLLPPFR